MHLIRIRHNIQWISGYFNEKSQKEISEAGQQVGDMEGASCTMVSAHRLTWSMWIGQSTPFLEEKKKHWAERKEERADGDEPASIGQLTNYQPLGSL